MWGYNDEVNNEIEMHTRSVSNGNLKQNAQYMQFYVQSVAVHFSKTDSTKVYKKQVPENLKN